MSNVAENPLSDVQNLHKAFVAFSQETKRLEEAYQALNLQFQRVNTELEESNRQLAVKVDELDSMTAYLNSILSHMAQGILFIREDGVVTTYNNEAEKILAVPATELLYFSFWDHFSDNVFNFSMREALETFSAPENQIIRIREGMELEVSVSFVLGGPEGMIILLRDITEFQRLRRQAGHNDRMKELGEMAASVAHEIRNPLGGIEGFASLLYRDLSDRPDLKDMARQIVDGSKTLNRLVSSVLHYSRPMELHWGTYPVLKLLVDIQRLIEADRTLSRQASIEVEGDPCELCMDRDMLKSALLNLAVNGIQAMDKGGLVKLSCKREGPNVVISVEDNGEGIPKERLEKMFQPFFTTKTHGNGFGLAEVHRIIQAHGGSIDVDSTVKEGSTFHLRLPASGIGGK